MQVLCGLQGIFLLFNCQTPAFLEENLRQLGLRRTYVRLNGCVKIT